MTDTPMVVVHWLDATHHDIEDGELDADTIIGIERSTIGFAVRDDERGIVLAMDYDDEGRFVKGFGIPRPYITKVDTLKVTRSTKT